MWRLAETAVVLAYLAYPCFLRKLIKGDGLPAPVFKKLMWSVHDGVFGDLAGECCVQAWIASTWHAMFGRKVF